MNFTNLNGHTVVAVPQGSWRGRRSFSRFDLRFNDPDASRPGVISAGPTTTAATWRSVQTVLYIGLGDGGSGNDPDDQAQNMSKLLGKMLRIDVNVPDSHPTDTNSVRQPFHQHRLPDRREIWNLGLRNPWRYSFDDVASAGPVPWSSATWVRAVRGDRLRAADAEAATTVGRREVLDTPEPASAPSR